MRTFFLLVFISLVGLAVGVGAVYYGDMQKSGTNVPLPSFKLPYKSFIAGTGIVEALSKNIVVGSQVSGIVKKVYVQSGDSVKKGDALFSIDDTNTRINLPILEAAVHKASVRVQSAKHQLDIIKKMQKVSANMVTKERYAKLLDAYNEAKANLQFVLKKRDALFEKLKLYTVYAPIDGVVLRSNITVGSTFDARSKALVLGSGSYNVKVNINEFDAWKFKKGAKAVAFIRGNTKQSVSLDYLYTIPMISPKTDITGSPTEQTDTRILQVVYKVNKTPDFPLYVGEMLDVFIESAKGK